MKRYIAYGFILILVSNLVLSLGEEHRAIRGDVDDINTGTKVI